MLKISLTVLQTHHTVGQLPKRNSGKLKKNFKKFLIAFLLKDLNVNFYTLSFIPILIAVRGAS